MADIAAELSVKDIKTRWRSVKDNFLRELKAEREESRSGAGASRRTPYRFKDHLQFLRPVLEQRLSEDNIIDDEEETEQDSSMNVTEDTLSTSTEHVETQDQPQPSTSSATNTDQATRRSDVQNKTGKKKSDNEVLISSLKSVMNVMEGEKKGQTSAYHLAMSLVPIIEEVPKQNMIMLRELLLDSVKKCIPSNLPGPADVNGQSAMAGLGHSAMPAPSHNTYPFESAFSRNVPVPSSRPQMYRQPSQGEYFSLRDDIHHSTFPPMHDSGYGNNFPHTARMQMHQAADVSTYRNLSTATPRQEPNVQRDESSRSTSACLADAMFMDDV
ncbi:uncharacterized protein [Hyperolius riggenbachi]|uniref:uncharacterized protein isoform X2 n=1 Tax=Hyperolius riggenbachi TaxID=752182 RepID=UPI0035A2B47F